MVRNKMSDIFRMLEGLIDNSQELEQLREEYFRFRQDNLDADTQIRDLTNEWRATSELLDLTKKEL